MDHNDKDVGHYFVIRYMFDELRDEAATVGVVLASPGTRRVTLQFLEDLSAKARKDARIDSRLIDDFCDWLDRFGADVPEVGSDATWLEHISVALRERTGNVLRISGPRAVIDKSPDTALRSLYDHWVAPRRNAGTQKEAVPRDPLGGIRREAQSLVRKTLKETVAGPARNAIQPHYPLDGKLHKNTFDAAFVPRDGSPVQVFQHVLILAEPEASFDQAAALARRWMDVQQKSGNHKTLTAVLISRENPTETSAPDAEELLRNDNIQVANVLRLRAIASHLGS